jgi:hypothetical protein
MLGSGHYGLDAFESAWSDLLPLYGEIFLLGDFNVDLFDSGNSFLASFTGLLGTFMLYNVQLLRL